MAPLIKTLGQALVEAACWLAEHTKTYLEIDPHSLGQG
jgi:hypothetical protein